MKTSRVWNILSDKHFYRDVKEYFYFFNFHKNNLTINVKTLDSTCACLLNHCWYSEEIVIVNYKEFFTKILLQQV